MKNKSRYSGDFDLINGQLDIRNRTKKNSKCWTCKDFKRLIKHIIDNRNRTDHPELLEHNNLRPDIKITNGNPKQTYKDFDYLIQLEALQNEVIKNHHRRKEDNYIDWGRGERIPARLGVSQLLLNPRHPDNQKFLDEWEKEITKIIIDEWGKDTDIVFHYDETSAGVHFIRKYYKFVEDKQGNITKAIIDKEKIKNDLSKEKLLKVHKRIEELNKSLAEKYGLEFRQEAGTIKSIERDIRTKQRIVDKAKSGEALNQKEKDLVNKIVSKYGKSKPEIKTVYKDNEELKKIKDYWEEHTGTELNEKNILKLVQASHTEDKSLQKKYNNILYMVYKITSKLENESLLNHISINKLDDLVNGKNEELKDKLINFILKNVKTRQEQINLKEYEKIVNEETKQSYKKIEAVKKPKPEVEVKEKTEDRGFIR